MKRCVIDASVAAEFLLRTTLGRKIAEIVEGAFLAAPELLDVEVLSVLRRAVLRQRLAERRARLARDALGASASAVAIWLPISSSRALKGSRACGGTPGHSARARRGLARAPPPRGATSLRFWSVRPSPGVGSARHPPEQCDRRRAEQHEQQE